MSQHVKSIYSMMVKSQDLSREISQYMNRPGSQSEEDLYRALIGTSQDLSEVIRLTSASAAALPKGSEALDAPIEIFKGSLSKRTYGALVRPSKYGFHDGFKTLGELVSKKNQVWKTDNTTERLYDFLIKCDGFGLKTINEIMTLFKALEID